MCSEARKKASRDWYHRAKKANPERFKDRSKRYRQTNPQGVRAAETRYYKARIAENKEFVLAYKRANPCFDCGEDDPRCLDFDHRDRRSKQFNVSQGLRKPLARLIAEIEKCDVRCANCHRKKTWRENHDV